MTTNKPPIYRLYRWSTHRELGLQRCEYKRGPEIGQYRSYAALVHSAERLAAGAGYPKSQWHELYDWNLEE